MGWGGEIERVKKRHTGEMMVKESKEQREGGRDDGKESGERGVRGKVGE